MQTYSVACVVYLTSSFVSFFLTYIAHINPLALELDI